MNKSKTGNLHLSNRKIFTLAVIYLLAVGGCFLFCWFFLCVAARILCSVDIPEQLYVPLATGCCTLAIFFVTSSFLRKIGQHGLVWGSAVAAGTLGVCFLIGILQGGIFSTLSLFRALLYLCCGMIGGLSGVLLYERQKKHRNR